MRRIGSYGVVTAALLLAAACSSGGGTTPSGFVRVKGSKVSVAHPESWRKGTPTSKIMTATASSPSEDAEVDVMENFLTGASKGSEDMLLDTIELGAQTNSTGYRRTHNGSADVKGAKAAVRVEYTFTDKNKVPARPSTSASSARTNRSTPYASSGSAASSTRRRSTASSARSR